MVKTHHPRLRFWLRAPRREVCGVRQGAVPSDQRARMVAIAPAKGARPPEKGSFPLDHGGECKSHMKVRALQCQLEPTCVRRILD